MGRRNRNKAKWRRSRYPGNNTNTEIMNTVHNQAQHGYHSHLVQEYESKQRRNKQLFEKAKSMVSKHFTDHTILTYFGNIKLEILRIIPLHPELSPELNLLRVMEQGSVLLGRIERCEIHDRKVYIRDIEDGEICFEYECSTDVVMPGRFIAIKNPKLNIFQDGKFGFRAEDEGCVLIIDVDHQQYDHQHSLNNMECAKCKRRTENLKRCTGCYGVSYCTRTCQRGDWADHKKICRTTTFLQEKTGTQDNSSASINRKVDVQSPDENNTEIGGAEKKVDKSCEEEPKIQSNLEQEREGIGSHKEECAFCKLDASKKCSSCKKGGKVMEMSCAQCHTTGLNLRKCSRCRLVYYCSKDCQAKNWPIHKSCCKYQEQNKTDDTEGTTDVLCGYCKTKSYDLKTCSGCRDVSYCSKVCQSRAWPDHKLTCTKLNRKKNQLNKDDLFRMCSYCDGMIVDLIKKCDCDGCSNIYCTKYCQANDWPRHKMICKSRQRQTGHQFQDADKRCNNCNKDVDLKLCSRCHGVNYCSKICQKVDWKNHKPMCRGSENANEKDMKRKTEIEMKLKEIATEQTKSFRQGMSSGPNQSSVRFVKSGDTNSISALFYDDFVDLTLYKTPASGSWDKALLFVRKTYPEHLILQQINKVPNEHGFVSSKQMLLLFIPRYHHYRGRHCVYVEDVDKVELYIAFYFTTDQSRCFKWSEIRPGRFIVILNPIIHHFYDTSVGFRLESPDVFKFIDI